MARKPVSDCPEALLKALLVVAERVSHLRKLYGWTQKDLAGVAGISLHFLREVEQSKLVETWVLWRIADAVRVRYAVFWVGEKRWVKMVAIREEEVGWDAKTHKPRAKQAGPGVELWEEL